LISFKILGRSFQSRFFAMSPTWVELTKKQPIETKAVGSLKEIGRWLTRFPLKVDKKGMQKKTRPCHFSQISI
jgi:hypothetical protein